MAVGTACRALLTPLMGVLALALAACSAGDDDVDSSSSFGRCKSDDECPAGWVCMDGTCVDGAVASAMPVGESPPSTRSEAAPLLGPGPIDPSATSLPPVIMTGALHEPDGINSSIPGVGVPDATVCAGATASCATSNADGAFQIEVPAQSRFIVTIEKDGYQPISQAGVSGTGDFASAPTLIELVDTATSRQLDPLGQLANQAQAPQAWLFLVAYEETPTGDLVALAGVTPRLPTMNANTAGPYIGGTGPLLSRSETTEEGAAAYLGVPVGDHELFLSHATLECAALDPGLHGWPGSNGGIGFQIGEAQHTRIAARCR